ncbi:MAG: LapA family protein [Desulfohalobiaceae bacterium]|nr:LapA family protein [Desulfohalobiaceae bacterium]
MRYVKVLVVVLLFLFGIIFFMQNTQFINTTITLQFNFPGIDWSSSPIPIYLFILLAFCIGVLVSLIYFSLDKFRQGRELKWYKTRVKSLEQEINSLRTLPLENQPAANENKE